jgi:hypothetical protein
MPASSAASGGVSSDAHFGRFSVGVESPQPVVAALLVEVAVEVSAAALVEAEVESNPYFLPKYTRAADSIPYAPLPK